MQTKETIINTGKYKFRIVDNTLFFDNKIYCRNIKIGGNVSDCVNVSISYNNGEPVSAYIPILSYSPECSIGTLLDSGTGSVIMINTIIDYVKKEFPMLASIKFEDMSSIECANEDEIKAKSINLRKKTYIKPIELYYFSIAFNGITWYEKYFGATMNTIEKQNAYRKNVNALMTSKPDFHFFLEQASPPVEVVDKLKKYYEKALSIESFFKSIPRDERCILVRDWLYNFMNNQLGKTFNNKDWIIPLKNSFKTESQQTTKKGGKNKTQKYYCPKGKINRHNVLHFIGNEINSETV